MNVSFPTVQYYGLLQVFFEAEARPQAGQDHSVARAISAIMADARHDSPADQASSANSGAGGRGGLDYSFMEVSR